MKREALRARRIASKEGLPYCIYHSSVWATHEVLLKEHPKPLPLCDWCRKRAWPKDAMMRQYKRIQSARETLLPDIATSDS